MRNEFLGEQKGIKDGVVPQSVTGATVNGDRVGMKTQERIAIVVSVAAAASSALSLVLKQHDAATSGNTKDLSVANRYYHKVAAATKFTKVEPSSAAATYDLFAIAGADKAVVVFEVLQEDLDVANGFNHVSVDVSGDATARIVHAQYIGQSEFKPAYELDL